MESSREEFKLDQPQIKKAVQALQAYLKSSSSSQNLFQNEGQVISLLLTQWKIPKKQQTIRIPLPHGLRTESGDICLFTRDEPNMTADQTERFYKRLLTEKGVKNVIECWSWVKKVLKYFRVYPDESPSLSELVSTNFETTVIPFKVLKTQYKPFEAKRRLLGNFDLFLSDARIRRRLPSHIGKHFYQRKKAPLSVDLESKQLARDLERLIQGTTLTISNKGSCCMAHVAHSGMTAEEIVENVIAAVSTISSKLARTAKNIKIIHLKSQTSVALPIYTSDLSHLVLVEEAQKQARLGKGGQKRKRENKKTEVSEPAAKVTEDEEEKDSDEEEMPQLVPIEMPIMTPTKKPKREGILKKGLNKVPKPASGKGLKNTSKDKKLAKKTPKVTENLKKKKLKANKV